MPRFLYNFLGFGDGQERRSVNAGQIGRELVAVFVAAKAGVGRSEDIRTAEGRHHGHHMRHWSEAEKAHDDRGNAMSISGSNPVNASKLVYLLPRIRLSGTAYRQDRFAIAKASFLPDEAKSWDEVLQLPRPDWLNIYRQFPYLDSDDPPQPLPGPQHVDLAQCEQRSIARTLPPMERREVVGRRYPELV